MGNEEANTRACDFEDFAQMLTDPDFEFRTIAETAALFGVSERTISNWRAKVDWEWIKTERRKRFASRMVEVDDSMLKAAKKGDVQAAKLVYERFDGYTPAQAIRLTDGADDELKKRAAELAVSLGTQPKPEESGTGSPLPGVSEAGA